MACVIPFPNRQSAKTKPNSGHITNTTSRYGWLVAESARQFRAVCDHPAPRTEDEILNTLRRIEQSLSRIAIA